MTWQIGLLLGLLTLAMILFSLEWVAADVVALGLLLMLVVTRLLPMSHAFAGFSSDTVIMILGLLIMTSALTRTGVIDLIARWILRHAGDKPGRLISSLTIGVAVLSVFMSNTAATAFFVPIAVGVARKAGLSPSQVLMPVAFGSLLSSSTTLISTSTNLVVSGLMKNAGLPPMTLFELAPVGVPIAVAGLLYMITIGRRLLPHRAPPEGLIESYGVGPYLTEILILPTSPLIGKTLAEGGFGRDLDLTVLLLVRNKQEQRVPHRELPLRADDVLLVEGPRDEILKIKDTAGIEIKADAKWSDPNLQQEDLRLVEAMVPPRSPLIGRTLKTLHFRERYGAQVLGLNRHGKNVVRKISQVPLLMGDVLLIQGHKNNVRALDELRAFRILGAVEEKRPQRRKALMAAGIFLAGLLLGGLQIVPLPVGVLMGAFGMFITRCATPDDTYREVEWKAVILISCMLGVGQAMVSTGTADYLAELLGDAGAWLGPYGLIAAVFALTVALSQPMSNQAAAALILPVAVQLAHDMQLNPRALAMTVALAASCSYLTPLEPSCLMVYGPGRYRFRDFLKVGLPLTVLVMAVSLLLVPRVWPLTDQPANTTPPAGAPATPTQPPLRSP